MTQIDRDATLSEVRAQRADLWRHLVALEDAVATPMPGRVGAWAAQVHDALVDLAATFERHVAVTEGTDGLFASVRDKAPRLEGALERLRVEHEEIGATLANELRALRGLDNGSGTDAAAHARERLTALLSLLSRHRQEGADLVYEAYAIDLGVGD